MAYFYTSVENGFVSVGCNYTSDDDDGQHFVGDEKYTMVELLAITFVWMMWLSVKAFDINDWGFKSTFFKGEIILNFLIIQSADDHYHKKLIFHNFIWEQKMCHYPIISKL